MAAHPTASRARERLIEAQRAESSALKVVEVAERAYERAASRARAADVKLATAQAGVVEWSGLERAARLLDVDPIVLRRRIRDATVSGEGDRP